MSPSFVFVPLTVEEASAGRTQSTQLVRGHVTRRQHQKSNALRAMQKMQPWTVIPYQPRQPSSFSQKPGDFAPGARQPCVVAAQSTPSELVRPFCVHDSDAIGDRSQHHPMSTSLDISLRSPNLPGRNGLAQEWSPLVMTEQLLAAASHYAVSGSSSLHHADLLHLKSRALTAINTELSGSHGVVSDAVICAVVKMAAYEAMFGDAAVYVTHMQGLSQMIKTRGGLGELGLGGSLEQLVVWVDANASQITGSGRITGGEDLPTKIVFPKSDSFQFMEG